MCVYVCVCIYGHVKRLQHDQTDLVLGHIRYLPIVQVKVEETITRAKLEILNKQRVLHQIERIEYVKLGLYTYNIISFMSYVTLFQLLLPFEHTSWHPWPIQSIASSRTFALPPHCSSLPQVYRRHNKTCKQRSTSCAWDC